MAKINELRERFNVSNYPLIEEYIRLFKAGVFAYCDEDTPLFESTWPEVIRLNSQISDQFGVSLESACRFANEYHDQTDFFNNRLSKTQSDHLYFIEDGINIKIGRTSNLKIRLSALQSSNPLELRYLAIFKGKGLYEFRVHELLSHIRVKGEWFKDCEEIRNYISDLAFNNSESAAIYGLQDTAERSTV